MINYDHVNDLAQYIDAANGNLKTLEEQTGQKLLVVILRDVLHEGRMVDLVIGGNHTLLAIEKSKYGFNLPVCDIPKSIHGAWIKPEVRGLSEYLNPISAIKKLETNEDDLIKTGVSFAHDYGQILPKSIMKIKINLLYLKTLLHMRMLMILEYNRLKKIEKMVRHMFQFYLLVSCLWVMLYRGQ